MAEIPDVRWRQGLQSFRKAFSHLDHAASLAQQRELSELEQQGLIQTFEFTHELAWNVLKDFLESRGASQIYGSKDATRQAFKMGLVRNGEAWMEMIKHRNLSTHTYHQEIAREIQSAILSSYVHEFREFLSRLTTFETEEA